MLHNRTGIEFVLLAVRPESDQHLQPFATASTRVSDFFSLALQLPLPDMATRVEAYCLSGLEGEESFLLQVIRWTNVHTLGALNSHRERLHGLKVTTGSLILRELRTYI
jgi:hypothetical protein